MSLDYNLVEGDDSLFICEKFRLLVYFSGLLLLLEYARGCFVVLIRRFLPSWISC